MKVKIFVDSGDYVHCCYCGANMLVEHGEEICPSCFTAGYLAWADAEKQECNAGDFDESECEYET